MDFLFVSFDLKDLKLFRDLMLLALLFLDCPLLADFISISSEDSFSSLVSSKSATLLAPFEVFYFREAKVVLFDNTSGFFMVLVL